MQYTTEDLALETGLTYHQVDDWTRRGILPGRRTSKNEWRRYSDKDVSVAWVLAELSSVRVSYECLKQAADFLYENPKRKGYLVVYPNVPRRGSIDDAPFELTIVQKLAISQTAAWVVKLS